MTIYYEYTYEQHHSFEVIKQRNQQFVSFTLYQDLGKLCEYMNKSKNTDHILLMDESRFDLFQYDCWWEWEQAFTIDDLNRIIKEKQDHIKQQHRPQSILLYHTINSIYHNGEAEKNLIWHHGSLLRKITFVYIKQPVMSILRRYLPKHSLDQLTIHPQTLFTINMLKDTLQRTRFLYVRISDTHVKLIECEFGCYKQLSNMNLWINTLKDIYKEHHILPLLYKSTKDIESNPYARSLVVESLDFYASLVCKRITDTVGDQIDCIIVSPLARHDLFIDRFFSNYHERVNGYVIPFSIPSHIKTFGHQRWLEDIDILSYLNSDTWIKHIKK
jgi:hypothetical protein